MAAPSASSDNKDSDQPRASGQPSDAWWTGNFTGLTGSHYEIHYPGDSPPELNYTVAIGQAAVQNNMDREEIHLQVKKIAMLKNRHSGIQYRGATLKVLAGKVVDVLSIVKDYPRHTPSYVHGTLLKMAGRRLDVSDMVSSIADGNLYKNLFKHFQIDIYEVNHSFPRHKCAREECSAFCLLPMFARRCIADKTCDEIMQKIKTLIEEYPEVICRRNTFGNEQETAKKMLEHLRQRTSEDDVLRQSNDTLLALCGDNDVIFNENALVDSRLYEQIFVEFRGYDYIRLSADQWSDFNKASNPWLSTEGGDQLQKETLGGASTDPSAPPEYKAVKSPAPTAPSAPPAGDPAAPPSYDAVMSGPQRFDIPPTTKA